MPESPRWLISKNRNKEAVKIFLRIAKWNKKPFEFLSELETFPTETKTVYPENDKKLVSSEMNNQVNINNAKNSTVYCLKFNW